MWLRCVCYRNIFAVIVVDNQCVFDWIKPRVYVILEEGVTEIQTISSGASKS